VIGDFVLALIGVVVGLLLLTVLVAVLVRPHMRRFQRARAALRTGVQQRTAPLKALTLARRGRG